MIKSYIIPLLALTFLGCSGKPSASSADSSASVAISIGSDNVDEPEFSADSAYTHIERQVSFGPRNPGSPAHETCRQYIADQLSAFGADTILTQKFNAKNFKGESLGGMNILGRFNTAAGRRILIAAHYDTRPWCDNDSSTPNHDQPIDGANDGASGVGVALELARLVGTSHPHIGVDFLFLDLEDSGQENESDQNQSTWCLGSQYWAKNLPYTPSERPQWGILLDMVGGRDARFYREFLSERQAPVINAKVWNAARQLGIERFVDQIYGGVTDDHIFISSAGIPCIDIIECGNDQTGSFPPYWHTLGDSLDIIDKATLSDVGKVVTRVIYSER